MLERFAKIIHQKAVVNGFGKKSKKALSWNGELGTENWDLGAENWDLGAENWELGV